MAWIPVIYTGTDAHHRVGPGRGAMGNMKRGISLTVGSDRHIPWAGFLSVVGVWRIHTAKQDRCCRSGSWDMNISWVGLVFWFSYMWTRGYTTDTKRTVLKGKGEAGIWWHGCEEQATRVSGCFGQEGGLLHESDGLVASPGRQTVQNTKTMNKHVKRTCGEERAWVDVVGRYCTYWWGGVVVYRYPSVICRVNMAQFISDPMPWFAWFLKLLFLGGGNLGEECRALAGRKGDEANRVAERPDKLYLTLVQLPLMEGDRHFHSGWFGNFFFF